LKKNSPSLIFSIEDDLTDLNFLNRQIKNQASIIYISCALTNLDDEGLELISHCSSIEELNLQETNITNKGISYLPRLKKLKSLRLKESERIDDDCMSFLARIESLEELHIQETGITEKGLSLLSNSNLKQVVLEIWKDNFSREGLIAFSEKLPNCEILAKGDFIIQAGTVM